MLIRAEQRRDHEAIVRITAQAFAAVEHSDQTEPAIIAALRAAGALTLSLVAVEGEDIIGHIAFSPVRVDGEDRGWFGLGPVSVRPDRQGEGVGGALIRQGLDGLRQGGAAGCVVLGDPDYYRRFAFGQDAALRYEGAPPDYFLRLAFGSAVPSGRVEYHCGFCAH